VAKKKAAKKGTKKKAAKKKTAKKKKVVRGRDRIGRGCVQSVKQQR
jgi:hypothetical protein